MPKISIIIPLYNCEEYICRCIDSILNQNFKDFELLLINDGSTDSTMSKISVYEKKYEFIRTINKENEGVAKTRNLGIDKATGKYIMFIDNDDFIDEDYLQNHYNAIVKDNFDIAISGYKRVDNNNRILKQKKLIDTYWSRYLSITPWAKIYKTSFIKQCNSKFFSYPIGEDVVFNLTLYSNKPKISIFNYAGYNWFYNKQSVSNTTHKELSSGYDIAVMLNKILRECSMDKYLGYYLRKFKVWYLLYSGKHSSSELFIEELNKINNLYKNTNINKEIGPFSTKLKGEAFSERLFVFIFNTLETLRLIKLFSKIYCKK